MNKTLLLAGVACLFAANASAEMTPYVGADYVYTMRGMDQDAENALVDHSHGGALVAGAKFNKWTGVEAFYSLTKQNSNHFGGNKYHDRVQAYGIDALGYLPLGCDQKVELLAGLGIAEYEMKWRKAGDGSDKEEMVGYRATVGAQYNIDENWSARAAYRHVYMQHSFVNDLNELSLGIRYNF